MKLLNLKIYLSVRNLPIEFVEIETKLPPAFHRYPVYIPQPDYDYNSNISPVLAHMNELQVLHPLQKDSNSYNNESKNNYRVSQAPTARKKNERNEKVIKVCDI